MSSSFRYQLTETPDGLQILIAQTRWKRFAKAVAWIAFWWLTPYLVFVIDGPKLGLLAFTILLVCSAIGTLGVHAAIISFRRSTIWLSQGEFRIRSGPFGFGKTCSYSMNEVTGFGWGAYSHSLIPVLKYEVGPKWNVLASDVESSDVERFLDAIKALGYVVPQ